MVNRKTAVWMRAKGFILKEIDASFAASAIRNKSVNLIRQASLQRWRQ
jgi:hypothetical protein